MRQEENQVELRSGSVTMPMLGGLRYRDIYGDLYMDYYLNGEY